MARSKRKKKDFTVDYLVCSLDEFSTRVMHLSVNSATKPSNMDVFDSTDDSRSSGTSPPPRLRGPLIQTFKLYRVFRLSSYA